MRRATWILWLMLALLPLRGWAVASMGLPAAEPAATQALAETAAPAMPCHAGGDPSADGSACQACDWCHASIAVPARSALAGVAPPAAPPRTAPARDTGRRLVGSLDRPPRSLAA